MSPTILLDYASSALGTGLALITAFRAGRSFPRWAFVVGTLVLAVEAALSGFSRDRQIPAEIAQWQTWRLLAATAIPGAWLFFSSSYARAKTVTFAARKGFALAFTIVFTATLAFGSGGMTMTKRHDHQSSPIGGVRHSVKNEGAM
jgi:hypothetical protein